MQKRRSPGVGAGSPDGKGYEDALFLNPFMRIDSKDTVAANSLDPELLGQDHRRGTSAARVRTMGHDAAIREPSVCAEERLGQIQADFALAKVDSQCLGPAFADVDSGLSQKVQSSTGYGPGRDVDVLAHILPIA